MLKQTTTTSTQMYSPKKRAKSTVRFSNSASKLSQSYFKVIPADLESNIPVQKQPIPEEYIIKKEEKSAPAKGTMAEQHKLALERRMIYSKEKNQYDYNQKCLQQIRSKILSKQTSAFTLQSSASQKKIPGFKVLPDRLTGLPRIDKQFEQLKTQKKEYKVGEMGMQTDRYNPEKEFDPLTNRQYLHLRPQKRRSESYSSFNNKSVGYVKYDEKGTHLEGNIKTIIQASPIKAKWEKQIEKEKQDEEEKLKKKNTKSAQKMMNIKQAIALIAMDEDNLFPHQKKYKFNIKSSSRLLKTTKTQIIKDENQKQKFHKPNVSLAEQARINLEKEKEEERIKLEQEQLLKQQQQYDNDPGFEPQQAQKTESNLNKTKASYNHNQAPATMIVQGYKSPYQDVQQFVVYQTPQEHKEYMKIIGKNQSPKMTQRQIMEQLPGSHDNLSVIEEDRQNQNATSFSNFNPQKTECETNQDTRNSFSNFQPSKSQLSSQNQTNKPQQEQDGEQEKPQTIQISQYLQSEKNQQYPNYEKQSSLKSAQSEYQTKDEYNENSLPPQTRSQRVQQNSSNNPQESLQFTEIDNENELKSQFLQSEVNESKKTQLDSSNKIRKSVQFTEIDTEQSAHQTQQSFQKNNQEEEEEEQKQESNSKEKQKIHVINHKPVPEVTEVETTKRPSFVERVQKFFENNQKQYKIWSNFLVNQIVEVKSTQIQSILQNTTDDHEKLINLLTEYIDYYTSLSVVSQDILFLVVSAQYEISKIYDKNNGTPLSVQYMQMGIDLLEENMEHQDIFQCNGYIKIKYQLNRQYLTSIIKENKSYEFEALIQIFMFDSELAQDSVQDIEESLCISKKYEKYLINKELFYPEINPEWTEYLLQNFLENLKFIQELLLTQSDSNQNSQTLKDSQLQIAQKGLEIAQKHNREEYSQQLRKYL